MPDDNTELVARAKAGDIPAFEQLYRQYSARIYNFARQLVGSADDAQDATQETFVKAWNALPGLRKEATFGVWLHRIALNVCRDLGRRESMEAPAEIRESSFGNHDTNELSGRIVASEINDAVHKAIESLSPEHRLVVVMHHVEGLDISAIAEILGISKGTVMSRLARARETLRRKLSAYLEP